METSATKTTTPALESLRLQVEDMLEYALEKGREVPVELICLGHQLSADDNIELQTDQLNRLKKMASAHQQLTRIVAPATPQMISMLAQDRRRSSPLTFLGKLPVLRQFSLLSIFFIVAFIGLAMLPEIGEVNVAECMTNDINCHNYHQLLVDKSNTENDMRINLLAIGFANLQGLDLLVIETFLLCCAGIGACFSNLYTINRYVGLGTYNPLLESTYWTRLIMGLMCGIIMAEVVPTSASEFGKPLVALLSGFASEVYYSMLQELVARFQRLFSNPDNKNNREVLQVEKQKSQLQQQRHQLNVANSLIDLKADLSQQQDPQLLKQTLDKGMNQILKQQSSTSAVD
ncbi:hypothetical protein [Pelagibaculum spongiae]|uniref:Uncharacterized protein n=1 Tax=Pelagibaculum spongiae TaxID=2080658 RepID=A0A2V1GN77_9GAMM|nr:hypothetical protein [Pelagibaculum spongiae]PVZ63468.1 hypothetical protein DC094_21415 [Pelagibaculum spongiae]